MKEAIIDTDILSFYLKGDADIIEQVLKYLNEYPTLNITSITYFEILSGLEYKKANRQIKDFKTFSKSCNILNIDQQSIELSAKKYGELRRSGITIGHSDLLIAGIALREKFELVSNNTSHFNGINGLKLRNWKR